MKKGKESADAAAMGGDVASGSSGSYDVCLSFRGPDTRIGFADFLYHCLLDAGIHAFRDDEELRVGDTIGGKLLRAIEGAKIYITIFSKNYASSHWCLQDLAAMVERKVKSGGVKTILPIFYDVKPRDVRLETPLYSDALVRLAKKFGSEEVEAWENALKVVGSLRGWNTELYSG